MHSPVLKRSFTTQPLRRRRLSNPTPKTTQHTNHGTASNSLSGPTQTQTEIALSENLVTKEHVESLTEFQAKVDAAKMEAAENGDSEVWVETSDAVCKYFNRKGLGKAGYFD